MYSKSKFDRILFLKSVVITITLNPFQGKKEHKKKSPFSLSSYKIENGFKFFQSVYFGKLGKLQEKRKQLLNVKGSIFHSFQY
jgi:hypothetical protein